MQVIDFSEINERVGLKVVQEGFFLIYMGENSDFEGKISEINKRVGPNKVVKQGTNTIGQNLEKVNSKTTITNLL